MTSSANKLTDDENNINKKQISTEFPFRKQAATPAALSTAMAVFAFTVTK